MAEALLGAGKSALADDADAGTSSMPGDPASDQSSDRVAATVTTLEEAGADEASASPTSIQSEPIGSLAGIPRADSAPTSSNAGNLTPPAAGGGGGGGSGFGRSSASSPDNGIGASSTGDVPASPSAHAAPSAGADHPADGSGVLPHPNDLPPDIQVDGNVADLLGFDVRLGTDGLFVGADIDLGQLHLDQVVSELGQGVGSALADLGHLLDVELPGLGDLLGAGERLSHITSTLADAAGLHLTDDLLGFADRLADRQDLGIHVGTPALGEATGDLLGAASNAAYLVGDIVNLDPAAQTGDLTAGDTIMFSAPASNLVALVDDLFNGGQYTQYGLVLRTDGTSGANGDLAASDTVMGERPVVSSSSASGDDASPSTPPPAQIDIAASPVDLPGLLEDLGTRIL